MSLLTVESVDLIVLVQISILKPFAAENFVADESHYKCL